MDEEKGETYTSSRIDQSGPRDVGEPALWCLVYVVGSRVLKASDVAAARPYAVVIDLEESVTPEHYDAARSMLTENCAAIREAGSKAIVRVKGLDTSHGMADAWSVSQLPSDVAVLLPKPVTPETVAALAESAGQRDIWLMGEEFGFIDRLPDIIASGIHLKGVVVGSKDLGLSIGAIPVGQRPSLTDAIEAIRSVADYNGLPVVAGVAMGDDSALRFAAKAARKNGYVGITLIRLRDTTPIHASDAEA